MISNDRKKLITLLKVGIETLLCIKHLYFFTEILKVLTPYKLTKKCNPNCFAGFLEITKIESKKPMLLIYIIFRLYTINYLLLILS